MLTAKESSYYSYARPELVALVRSDAKVVLDVGCGAGALGQLLKRVRHGVRVVGIEKEPIPAALAKERLDDVVIGDIEHIELDALPIKPGDADCLIFGDVLEHLVDPWSVLERFRTLVRAGGQVLISLPNVRNVGVIAQLLRGRWDYQNAGILDNTHLRFFTLSSALHILSKTGYEVNSVSVVHDPALPRLLNPGDPPATLKFLHCSLSEVSDLEARELEAVQLIFDASPKTLDGNADYHTVTRRGTQCSVIVLCRNQMEYTKRCIESIVKNTSQPYELICVDNGSSDGTREYLQDLAKLGLAKIVRNDSNLGFAAGMNTGLTRASGEIVVFLNNDTVVTEGWLDRLVTCLYSNPQYGVAGPLSNRVGGQQRLMQHEYDEDIAPPDELETFGRKVSLLNAKQYKEVDHLFGVCLAVKREVIQAIGGFDPLFGLGNFEDNDFVVRARLAGFQSVIARDVYIHHFGSKTFAGERIDYRASLLWNWRLFKLKWRLPPSREYETGYAVQELLERAVTVELYVPFASSDVGSTVRVENGQANIQLAGLHLEDIRRMLLDIFRLANSGVETFRITLSSSTSADATYEALLKSLQNDLGFTPDELPAIIL